MIENRLVSRLVGFIASLVLTLATYFIVLYPEFFHLDGKMAIGAIFILALFQFVVQLMFFINLWNEKGPLWNLGVFISTLLLIFIIIAFSIWIMDHLNYNMMMR